MESSSFTILFLLILYFLTLICFVIPYTNERKLTGTVVGTTLGLIITISITWQMPYGLILLGPLILLFQIIFITYWTFRAFNRKKTGKIVTSLLTISSLFLLLQPWISDWTFSKGDVRKILIFHSIELKDDFKIIKNESGGLSDYYETFTIKLSDSDFNRLSQTIKNPKNYKDSFSDNSSLSSIDHKKSDTIDFETGNYFEREYFANKKMENGTDHFIFHLDKQTKELIYTGSDE